MSSSSSVCFTSPCLISLQPTPQITLSAYNPSAMATSDDIVTVTLKDTTEGGMATTLRSISFSDSEMTPFPNGPSSSPMAGESSSLLPEYRLASASRYQDV
jgi:hypothetical protein